MENTTIFTKKQLQQLMSTDSIVVKEDLVSKLEDRVDYIVRQCIFKENKTQGWWSWEYYEGDGDGPEFKNARIDQFAQWINLNIQLNTYSEIYFIYDGKEYGFESGFPLEFLWDENISETIKVAREKYQKQQKNKKAEQKRRNNEIKSMKLKYRESAIKKLSPEEKWACGLSRKFPNPLKTINCFESCEE